MPLFKRLKMFKTGLLVLCMFILESGLLWAKEVPLYIQSDQMEVDYNKKMIVFTGHVKLRQEDMLMQADLMRVYYHTPQEKVQGISKQQIERIEAEGHVVIKQGERQAKGEKAVFLKEKGEIVLTGHPVLQEDKNMIKGEKVIIFLNKNKMTVLGGKLPVEAVIYKIMRESPAFQSRDESHAVRR